MVFLTLNFTQGYTLGLNTVCLQSSIVIAMLLDLSDLPCIKDICTAKGSRVHGRNSGILIKADIAKVDVLEQSLGLRPWEYIWLPSCYRHGHTHWGLCDINPLVTPFKLPRIRVHVYFIACVHGAGNNSSIP